MVYIHNQGVIKRKLSIAGLLLLAGLFALLSSVGVFSTANAASGNIYYDAIDTPIPSNVESVGFEATSTKELGDRVLLAGEPGKNVDVTVMMSSWGCEDGAWNKQNCVTTDGATFAHPITLNVYNTTTGDAVGSLITSKTQTFDIPYRPSADAKCVGREAGKWYDGTACKSGLAVPITFSLKLMSNFPKDVILGVAYNTSNYGSVPMGIQPCQGESGGCGYDSLNVGVKTNQFVYSGTDQNTDKLYWDSTYEGRASGFAVDTAWSPNGTVGFRVAISNPSSKEDCKKGSFENFGFKNQGLCIQYVNTGKDSRLN